MYQLKLKIRCSKRFVLRIQRILGMKVIYFMLFLYAAEEIYIRQARASLINAVRGRTSGRQRDLIRFEVYKIQNKFAYATRD